MATLAAAGLAAAADSWSKNQQAKKQFSYQKQLSNLNFKQQKYFAENAHQMEMADLEAAGLNPALTATGGSGASASGGGIPGAQGTQAADILGGLKTLIDAKNQTSATKSQNDLNRAQALNTIAQTDNIPYQNKIALMNGEAAKMQAEAATTNASANFNEYWLHQKELEYKKKKYDAETKFTNERSRGFHSSNGMSSMFGGVTNSRSW